MPLGDWATWVQSVATVGALVAAVVAAFVAQRVFRIESERDERTAEERRVRFEAERRVQADKVAAWYSWWPPDSPDMGRRFEYGAVIRNASDLPIYDVDVDFYYVMPNAGSGNVPSRRGGGNPVRVLPPREQEQVPIDEAILRQTDEAGRTNYAVAVEFRDATGTRWRRDVDGELTDLSSGRK